MGSLILINQQSSIYINSRNKWQVVCKNLSLVTVVGKVISI